MKNILVLFLFLLCCSPLLSQEEEEFVPHWKKNLRELKRSLAEKRKKLREKLIPNQEEVGRALQTAKEKIKKGSKKLAEKLEDIKEDPWEELAKRKLQIEKQLRKIQLRAIDEEQKLLKQIQEIEQNFEEKRKKLVQKLEQTQLELQQKKESLKNELTDLQRRIEEDWDGVIKTTDEVWEIEYGEFMVTFLGISFNTEKKNTRSYAQKLGPVTIAPESKGAKELIRRWNKSLARIQARVYKALPHLINVKSIGALGSDGQINLYNPSYPLNALKGAYKEETGKFYAIRPFQGEKKDLHHGSGFMGTMARVEGHLDSKTRQGKGKFVYTLSLQLTNKKKKESLRISVDIWVLLTFVRIQ